MEHGVYFVNSYDYSNHFEIDGKSLESLTEARKFFKVLINQAKMFEDNQGMLEVFLDNKRMKRELSLRT